MTLTKTCSTLKIQSDIITDLVNNSYPANIEVKLDIIINDGTEPISVTLDDSNISEVDNSYTLTPSDLDQVDEFTDQILDLTITETNTDTGAKSFEYSCIYVGCTYECKIINHLATYDDATIHAYYQVLENYNICEHCNCEDIKTLYNTLTDKLNLETDAC